jgi:DNA (cytosine-5)-methyltransferase 1
VNELALFAGAGGGILGGHLLGWRCVCAVEYNAYARSVLLARQNDGTLPPFPIWDDVRTFDGRPWRGVVDVVSGGFPCQDISVAGKGDGLDGERSGLWSEMARIIGEVRPRFAFVENSPMLTSRGLGRVLGDLAALGFDAEWGVLGAADVGAPHLRERIWIMAHAERMHRFKRDEPKEEWGRSKETKQAGLGGSREDMADASSQGLPDARPQQTRADGEQGWGVPSASGWWRAEPALGRVADGVAHRVDRLKAIGNGQVSRVAATAWRVLTEEA